MELPHLYKKLLGVIQEKATQRYMRRKDLHAKVAHNFHMSRIDVDMAVKELEKRGMLTRRNRRVAIPD